MSGPLGLFGLHQLDEAAGVMKRAFDAVHNPSRAAEPARQPESPAIEPSGTTDPGQLLKAAASAAGVPTGEGWKALRDKQIDQAEGAAPPAPGMRP